MSGYCATRVANHPQSLWITLWASFRHLTQVTYRKGFFFDRSNFERSVFYALHQALTFTFPSTPDAASARRPGVRPGQCAGG